MIGALLLPIIAMANGCASKTASTTIAAAAPGRQLQLVSTAWSPFTNVPGQARFALYLVDEALARVGITAETVIVDEARLTPSLLIGEFDGSAALWRDAERERVLHLDWIQADVDGDGLREYVPHDDSVGSDEPTRAYDLTWKSVPLSSSPRRFYFDGSIYDGWSNVPHRFRDPIFDASEPSRITPVFFSFKWEL